MISSTLPLADRCGGHPVHRATALLRQALLTSTASRPDPAEIWGDSIYRLDRNPIELSNGPISMGSPAPLHTLLGLQPLEHNADVCQSPVTYADDGSAPYAPFEDASGEGAMLDATAQLQLQALVQAFHRRQRQVSLIVAASIIAAFVLTFGALILLFGMTGPNANTHENAVPSDRTSVAHAMRRADIAPPLYSLLIRAKAELQAIDQGPTGARVIRATVEHPLALGPLLPLGSAGYLLLRGLPRQAELSAGRKTGTGTWMVKAEDVANLTLRLTYGAGGDYPFDVYLLGTKDTPQARRRLVLRIEQPTHGAAAAKPVAPAGMDAGALHDRAQTLLRNGDVAAARRLLTRLAETGHAHAAYELGLTYDREVLERAGIRGVNSDTTLASAWYEYAAREGHAGAIERLRALTKRRGDV